jgi:hypothetical protein
VFFHSRPLFFRAAPEVIVLCRHVSGIFALAVVLFVGCQSAEDVSEERLARMAGGKLKDVVPISGKVLVDGVPQGGVNLYLYKSSGGLTIAECRTDSDGTYCWTSHTECDGLEAGKYRLGFKYLPKRRRNEKGDDLFEGRYSDPLKVDFLLTVEEDSPRSDVDYDLTTK